MYFPNTAVVAILLSSIYLLSDSDFLFHETEKRPNIKIIGRKLYNVLLSYIS